VIGALDQRAREVLPDARAVDRHDGSIWALRELRDEAARATPDFEALRSHASRIKAHTLDSLDRYLADFEQHAIAAGTVVHWAEDAAAHNEIVLELLRQRRHTRVVKSKSMLTEECGLNPFLARHGIEVVDTDLGERIVQLADEPPSHIVMPAIHKTKEQIGELFHRTMDLEPGVSDPDRLVGHAREDMRARFLGAHAGISGVNFAVAQTGHIVVCTNEGNADLGTSLPNLHIACMGIEKIIPTLDDLPVFLRLLARSATGQAINAYTSIFGGPQPGSELHVVIVDNGRSELLADPGHRASLRCIRCAACLNTCPVYRHSGGHAYGLSVAGPIGSVLAPALAPGDTSDALPFASTLCGSCSAVCPVEIDLHDQLLRWRRERSALSLSARLLTRGASYVMSRPALYRRVSRWLRRLWPRLSSERASRSRANPAARWLHARELPDFPPESFGERYLRERGPDASPVDVPQGPGEKRP
jgi:L-lactate dehydrogenase complex protein LldF